MSREEMLEKLKELENSPEFVEKIKSLNTTAEMSVLFTEAGFPITEAELEEVYKLSLGENEELSERSLDDVSGGCKGWWYKVNPFYWLGRWMGGRVWKI